ncbi:NADH:flavin oxidoreductase [Candidatus Hydrogenedentota bacterium]
MSKLFENTSINGMTLLNRFLRSATWTGMADDSGSPEPALIEMMTGLARGGVGLIITGHAYVLKEGQASRQQLGAYDESLLPHLRQMTEAIHEAGGTIVLQLAHAGVKAATSLSGCEAVGPSMMENKRGPFCRAMTQNEIRDTVQAFGTAAALAVKAGFDGVQIHAAHGYLLSQFLSPFYNKREDEYGGSIENRAKIILEVVKSIRGAVPEDFPVLIKINSEDFLENGFTVDEMIEVCAMLEAAGIDAIEMSGGTSDSPGQYMPIRRGEMPAEEDEVYYSGAARLYKQKIKVPLILVGGIRSYGVAEKLVDEGLTDFISLCRPLIREPDLIKRWESGDTAKASCVSCNSCLRPGYRGEGIRCVALEKARK